MKSAAAPALLGLLLLPALGSVATGLWFPFAGHELHALHRLLASVLRPLSELAGLDSLFRVLLASAALGFLAGMCAERRGDRGLKVAGVAVEMALCAIALVPAAWVVLLAAATRPVLLVAVPVVAGLASRQALVLPRPQRLAGPGGRGVAVGTAAAVILLAAATAALGSDPESPVSVAGSLFVAGPRILGGLVLLVVLVAAVFVPRGGPELPARGLGAWDPRNLWLALLPIVVFGGFLFATDVGGRAAEVESLSERRGVFGLAVDPVSGEVIWTDRRHNLFGRGSSPATSGPSGGLLESVYVDGSGGAWAGQLDIPSGDAGLLSLDDPRVLVATPGCLPTAWLPLPSAADAALPEARPGDVLVGCEWQPRALLFRPSEARVVADLPWDGGLEQGAWSSDRATVWGVQVWGDPHVEAHRWPPDAVVQRRLVGPLNWTIARLPDQGVLVVGLFLQGGLLLLDEETLEVTGRVRLSFGVRNVVVDPDRGRIWASAPYSGRLWEIDAADPSSRREHRVCGGARALVLDAAGRAIVGTDCGIVAVAPEDLRP